MAARRRRRRVSSSNTRGSSRRRRTLPALALLVLLICGGVAASLWEHQARTHVAPEAPPQQQATQVVAPATIRIASWNLRQFSDRPGIDLRAIAQVINTSQFDVLAIQEVKKEGQQVDQLLNVLGPPWRGASISPRTGNSERFAFLYRGDRLQPLGRASFVSGRQIEVFDRTPYQTSFRAGQFDFTLVTVHFSYSDVDRRRREAQTLAGIVRDLADRGAEKDVIVLGDLNEQRGRENMEYFRSAGWRTLTREPTNLGSRQIFDHLLINPQYTREWSRVSGVVAFDESLYHNDDRAASASVSDHRPIYADFATTMPDDD